VNYKYFTHADCLFFPCHELDEWASCLFCWCPLYLLECDGNFAVKGGIKDCSGCIIPHTKEGYDHILDIVQKDIFGRQHASHRLFRCQSQDERKVQAYDGEITQNPEDLDGDVF
jgi:Zn-finger protein